MNKDHIDTKQQIMKKLASEEGLMMIKTLADKISGDSQPDAKVGIFKDAVLPFFRTISHPDVLSSLILETPVDTIYTFLFGPNGRRALDLFMSITAPLGALAENVAAEDGDTLAVAATATLVVLERIVELNQSAQVITGFASVTSDLLVRLPEPILQAGSRSLNRICQRLGCGTAMGLSENFSAMNVSSQAVFELDQDLPGSLSSLGQRHDNDHPNIVNIKILPTAEEIQSSRTEYLPSNDHTKYHLPGLAGLLDRQFRLLREDTVGQLRDAIHIEYQRLQKPVEPQPQMQPRNSSVRSITHHNVTLIGLEFDRKRGLQIVADFDQPLVLAKKGLRQRKEWWQNSKYCQPDALVCFVSSTGRIMFFNVCDPTLMPAPERDDKEKQDVYPFSKYDIDSDDRPSLFQRANRAAVILTLVEDSPEDVTWITTHLCKAKSLRKSLVEFPGLLLASFRPTLQALQRMSCTLDLPFSQIIVPSLNATGDVDVPAPAYSRRPGFSFDLATLTGGNNLSLTPGQPFDDTILRETSTLDQAQQVSTINALRRSFALIQGPPGTGKSYTGIAIIKALLNNRNQADLGPILCVCYTNHALDQLLEHLVKDGVDQLIRIGSRSKSEILRNANLYEVSKNVRSTKYENYTKHLHYEELHTLRLQMEDLMLGFRDQNQGANLREYLETFHQTHFQSLFYQQVDAEGFQEVHGKNFDVFNGWLRNGPEHLTSTRPISELLDINLLEMSSFERGNLHTYWVQEAILHLNRRLLHVLDSYHAIRDALNTCHQEINLRCLLSAHVIGVTSTGLARNLEILSRVRAKVVMIEEAGEVLEAHTLTALLPSVEHAILIGDHEQLRPQINNFEFQCDNPRGVQFSLDVSLFERLVQPQLRHAKIPYDTLEVQRRMHPSIAELIRSTLYPRIQDHSSLSDYPVVEGMRKRLFWLDHDNKEDSSLNSAQPLSKTNNWEVEMVTALVFHLVRQGVYRNEDIAVLTPYLGQLQKIKQRLQSSFAIIVNDRDMKILDSRGMEDNEEEDSSSEKKTVQKTTLLNALRVATVDNFQGEEAKVVIVSLVRCNKERKCGFLKTSNRINVLLSRARHGMYIIGSIQTARPVPMWDKIITILETNDNVGQALELCCPRHMETPIEVSKPDDFSIFSPEGGCQERCILRLSCGHVCINKCHSDSLHSAVRCLEECLRTKKGCSHLCPKFCGDPCHSKCQIKMSDITLPCQHTRSWLPCYQAQAPETVHCSEPVEIIMPDCKHKVKVRCHETASAAHHSCDAQCGAYLDCGHKCQQICKDCNKKDKDGKITKANHGLCNSRCGRPYTTCSHSCFEACHGDRPCQLCPKICELRCSHSRCNKKCHEPCVPCVKQCSWSCPHRGACQLPCAVPCDLLPCSKRCTLSLDCGHQCPSVCGEKCPNSRYCQKCADESVKNLVVDYIMALTYTEIDLNHSPCIFPSCGHILTLESMDGHMEIQKHYIISEDPNAENPITALKTRSIPFSSPEMKNCPMCRSPLRNINRYGRIVRRAWIDEATKKFIVWANSRFVPLAFRTEMVEAQLREAVLERKFPTSLTSGETQLSLKLANLRLEPIRLTGSCDQQISIVRKAGILNTKCRAVFTLRTDIKRFRKEVDESEQPISRIHDLIQGARNHRGVETEDVDLPSVLQVRNRLLATALLIRCDYAILLDFVTHITGAATGKASGTNMLLDLALNRRDCEVLIQDSHSRRQPMQETEGLLYWVRFAALERDRSASLSEADMQCLIDSAHAHIQSASALCHKYPGQTAGMHTEVSEAKKMLHDSTAYAPVTNEEKAAVYAAMAQSFRGTGHWYNCVNGHPFTIGECGMPMETAICPQCGAPIGGMNHEAVSGVTRATEMDEVFGGR